MNDFYNAILKITAFISIVFILFGCSPIPYRISNVYANTRNGRLLSKEVKAENASVRSDVIGMAERRYTPVILLYEHKTRIIVKPDALAEERYYNTFYELTLPSNPIKAANNGNCEVVLKYNDNQIVWVYDGRLSKPRLSTNSMFNSWLGLNDGFHEVDTGLLTEILNTCPLYVYDKTIAEFDGSSNNTTYKDCMEIFTNSSIFHNSTLRYIVCDGQDSLAYDKTVWSCGMYYGEPPERLKKDVTFIPRDEKLPKHIGSFNPFIVTKNCSPLLRMPKIRKGRRNFIYVKDGFFVLVYNLLPRNYPIFRAMIENTLVVRPSSTNN